MKKLPLDFTATLSRYVKGLASYSYTMDRITEYIENKNLNNETAKIKMIMNDLRIARRYLENGKTKQAKNQYDFVKNTLLTIK